MSVNKVGGPGSYNAICDVCGLKFKASELTRRWDGMMVDHACWEPRHPQEFVRAINDTTKLPFIRVDSDGIDVSPDLNCTGIYPEFYSATAFNSLLDGIQDTTSTYSILKISTYGGTVTIPDGFTLTVQCTLEIQP